MARAPFQIRDDLTAITLGYSNKEFIADSVLPRVPVKKQEFRYTVLTQAEQFRIPDLKVGRTGRTPEIEFSSTQSTDYTEDYGLEDPIPQVDIDNSDSTFNPEQRATEQLSQLLLLGREKRVADLVFTAGNYAAANKTTLSGTAQWSDFVNSDPMTDITVASDSMLMAPNVMIMGRMVFNRLRMHPKIAKAINGNQGDSAIVARQAIADLFEMEEVLVGASFVDGSVKGQTSSMTRIWGKSLALIYRNKQADTNKMVTFGLTAQFGNKVAGEIIDPNIGLRGGKRIRVGESVREKILASDCGYLFTNAVA